MGREAVLGKNVSSSAPRGHFADLRPSIPCVADALLHIQLLIFFKIKFRARR
jgi:hypothetical protein